MFVAAVTGTNGKTSVVEFARQLVESAGQRAASLGNRGLVTAEGTVPPDRIGGGRRAVPDLITKLQAQGYDAFFFEAYSAALARGLLDDVVIDAAAFTHISEDHLDVHGSMEAYRAAKARLFNQILPPGAAAILHPGSPGVDLVEEAVRERGLREVRCGPSELTEIQRAPDGTFFLGMAGRAVPVGIPEWPEYVYSSVELAVALCQEAGVAIGDIARGLGRLELPPGRLEDVAPGALPRVVVDYAHNPGGLEAVLGHLRETTRGQLWLIIGCGGGREERASAMAAVARRLADMVIVTDDNPRFTPRTKLRRLLLANLPTAIEVADRLEAIRQATLRAGEDDVVLIAGKGEEEWIDLGTRRRRHSDVTVARLALQRRHGREGAAAR